MSVWKRLRDSAISGAGFAVGASAGRDLYEAAKKKVNDVDWEKVRDDAGQAAGKLGQSMQEIATNLQEQVAPKAHEEAVDEEAVDEAVDADEAVQQARELLREAADGPVKRTL